MRQQQPASDGSQRCDGDKAERADDGMYNLRCYILIIQHQFYRRTLRHEDH